VKVHPVAVLLRFYGGYLFHRMNDVPQDSCPEFIEGYLASAILLQKTHAP
jgi:hypothetical protein